MTDLEQRVENLEKKLPALESIRTRYSLKQTRGEGWCKQPRTVKHITEFSALCQPLVDYLQRNYLPSALIVIDTDSATLYSGQIGVPYNWDYCDPEAQEIDGNE